MARRIAFVLNIAALLAVVAGLCLLAAPRYETPSDSNDWLTAGDNDWVTKDWHWSEGVRHGRWIVIHGDSVFAKPVVNGPHRGKWMRLR